MRRLILVLGGARSGKSHFAQALAEAHVGTVAFVATALAFDDEMRARISRHQAERPSHWTTIEAPTGVAAAITRGAAGASLVLVDCLTLLANNVMLDLPEPIDATQAEQALQREVDDLLRQFAAGTADYVLISNEVGLGLVPDNRLGRVYRDALGKANQWLAARADVVVFMVAGQPLFVKGVL